MSSSSGVLRELRVIVKKIKFKHTFYSYYYIQLHKLLICQMYYHYHLFVQIPIKLRKYKQQVVFHVRKYKFSVYQNYNHNSLRSPRACRGFQDIWGASFFRARIYQKLSQRHRQISSPIFSLLLVRLEVYLGRQQNICEFCALKK